MNHRQVRERVRGGLAVAVCALALTWGGGGEGMGQVAGGGVGGGGGGGGGFFGLPAPVAFNPEPSAVFSGHSLHVGAVVSADRKYVGLNMGVSETRVTGVQNFPVYFAGGFAGAPGAGGQTGTRPVLDPNLKGPSGEPVLVVSASPPLAGVLAREGMTRLGGLE